MTTPIEAIEPIHAISPVQAVGAVGTEKSLPNLASTASMASRPSGTPPTTRASADTQLNVSILQASIDVSISSGNESLALLLQTAIAGINDLLEPTFGKDAIQNTASQDHTPAGTAERIVSLSTGFYAAFQQQHAGEPEAGVLEQFMATIRGGFEQGYKEARDILQGMNVLSGDIASNIDETYALVLQGYADFAAAHSGGETAAAEQP